MVAHAFSSSTQMLISSRQPGLLIPQKKESVGHLEELALQTIQATHLQNKRMATVEARSPVIDVSII